MHIAYMCIIVRWENAKCHSERETEQNEIPVSILVRDPMLHVKNMRR